MRHNSDEATTLGMRSIPMMIIILDFPGPRYPASLWHIQSRPSSLVDYIQGHYLTTKILYFHPKCWQTGVKGILFNLRWSRWWLSRHTYALQAGGYAAILSRSRYARLFCNCMTLRRDLTALFDYPKVLLLKSITRDAERGPCGF